MPSVCSSCLHALRATDLPASLHKPILLVWHHVHLALTGALSTVATISSSIRGITNKEECKKWHDTKVSTAYTW